MGNTEELGIRMSASGVVETTTGVNLTGKAVDNLGQKLDEAGKQGAKLDAGARQGAAGAKVAETAARELAEQLGRTIPVTGELGQTLQTLGGDGAQAVARLASSSGLLGGVLGGLAVVGGAVAVAWMQGREEAQRYFQALTLTGNAAGVTSAQMGDMARRIDGIAGTQRQASEALTALASTGRVAGSAMEAAGLAAVQMERITGQAVQKTVAEFSALGKDPLRAVMALNESTNFLTTSVYDQVRALSEQGNETAAAAVAQNAYAEVLLPRLKQIEQSQGFVERGWRTVKDAAKEAWDAMMDVGRTSSPEQRLEKAQKALEEFDKKGNEPRRGTLRTAGDRAQLRASLLSELGIAQSDVREERRLADGSAGRAQLVKDYDAARTANQKWTDAALTNTQRMDRALQEYRKNNEVILRGGGAVDQAQVAREEAAIRAKFTPRGRATKPEDKPFTELDTRQAAFRTAELQSYGAIEKELRRERLDALKQEEQERNRSAQAAEREASSLQRQVDQLEEETATMGLNAAALAARRTAQVDAAIADRQAQLARLDGLPLYDREAEALREQIRLLGQLRGDIQTRSQQQQQEDQRRDFETRRKGISDALLDGLRNGFDGGRKLANAFLDDLVTQFDKTYLRPHLDIMAQGLMSAVDGLIGAIGGGLSSGAGSLLSFFGFHGGGVGANENSFVRAPRFHTGVGPDEMHAVIQKSEGVFTRGQMKAMASMDDVQRAVGGGRPSLVYSPTINVPERSDRATILSDVGRMLKASQAELLEKMERGMV